MRSITKFALIGGCSILVGILLRQEGMIGLQQGVRPGIEPVEEISGQPRPSGFEITADREVDLKALQRIAQSYHHTRDGMSEFEEDETRIELEAILSGAPDLFHTQSLLAAWHDIHGDTAKASEYRNAAIEAAPVILTIPVRFGPNHPAASIQLETISIEHTRFTQTSPLGGMSIDPSVQLVFVNVTSDPKGVIRLPVYDTVFRLNSWSHPKDLHADMRPLGWFKSNRQEGILPTLWVWNPYAPAPYFERTASQSSLLGNAKGTEEDSIKGRLLTFRRSVSSDAEGLGDRARIRIIAEGNGTFEIDPASIHVLESKTKIPLHRFQSGAGFQIGADAQFELFSFWKSLPPSVDVVFEAHEYNKDAPILTLQPRVGASATSGKTRLTIDSINDGRHQSWSSTAGYSGEVSDTRSRSEFTLRAQSDTRGFWSLWILDTSGRKRLQTQLLYLDPNAAPDMPQYFPLSIGLDQIAQIEFRPQSDPQYTRLYFENVQLPDRPTGALQEPEPIEFTLDWQSKTSAETIGAIYNASSQAWSPIHLEFTVRGNQHISSTSWSNAGYSVEYNSANASPTRPYTLYEWTTNARFDVDWELTLLEFNSDEPIGQPIRARSSGDSAIGSFEARGFNMAPESATAARLQMTPIKSKE